jgi:hypothetical protein
VNAPEPTIATKDSVLNLGPDLIHHHAVLDLTLLLEGPPALDPAGLILKDVDLQRGVPPTVKINQIKELLYTTIGGVGVTIVTILVILVH